MPDPIASVPDDYVAATQQATAATAKLQAQLTAPAFRQQAKNLMQARVEYEKTFATLQRINQQEALRARQMDVQRRYGRALGGAINAAGAIAANPLAQQAWGAAQYGASYARSMAARGFEGTLEKGRLDNELELISRELAGVMKPATDALTRWTMGLRKSLEGMSARDQDSLLYGVGGVAGAGLLYRHRGTAGAVLGGAATLSNARNVPAAYRAGGALGTAGTLLKGAGRVSGVLLAVDLGKSMVGLGQQQAPQTDPYRYTFQEQHPEYAKHLAEMDNAKLQAHWDEIKDKGRPNRLLAGLGNAGKWGWNTVKLIGNQIPVGSRLKYNDENSEYDQVRREIRRQFEVRGQSWAEGADRRKVMPGGGGVEPLESGYFRIMERYGKVQADRANGVEGEPDTGTQMVALLEQLVVNTAKTPAVS